MDDRIAVLTEVYPSGDTPDIIIAVDQAGNFVDYSAFPGTKVEVISVYSDSEVEVLDVLDDRMDEYVDGILDNG